MKRLTLTLQLARDRAISYRAAWRIAGHRLAQERRWGWQ